MIEQMVAFLTARNDEDERFALAATGGSPWVMEGMAIRGTAQGHPHVITVVKHTWPQEAAHIVRHDPVRVLRQTQATRRLLRRYELALAAQNPPSTLAYIRDVGRGYIEAHEEAIRDAVNVHSGHPDWRPEWAREQGE